MILSLVTTKPTILVVAHREIISGINCLGVGGNEEEDEDYYV